MKSIVLGIDLGGTHVRIGAFDADGQVLAQQKTSIASIEPEDGLRLIENLIRQTLDSVHPSHLSGIGIGAGSVKTTAPISAGNRNNRCSSGGVDRCHPCG